MGGGGDSQWTTHTATTLPSHVTHAPVLMQETNSVEQRTGSIVQCRWVHLCWSYMKWRGQSLSLLLQTGSELSVIFFHVVQLLGQECETGERSPAPWQQWHATVSPCSGGRSHE